ncbi:MAG: putative exosortase B-associated extracellular polysaccharide biosynthesis transporter EpsL [Candidatus Pacebacteria bacterium]|nr:putative exosortase B-associated extracellular polysaccharide biosynthesis transporter EpsL [Candidatus Paceibacterota bacterium]
MLRQLHFSDVLRDTELLTSSTAQNLAASRLFLLVVVALLNLAGVAHADGADTLNLRLSRTLITDNNLFRLPAGIDPSDQFGNSRRSDSIAIDSIGLSLDKSYSLQQFHADASFANYRFGTYRFLNHSTRSGTMRWNWALTPRLTGKISSKRQQSLNSFVDYTNIGARNLKTATNNSADLDYWISGGWHVTAGGFRDLATNDIVFLQGGDRDFRGDQFGLRYVAADGDYIAYQNRHGRGKYPNATLVVDTLSETDFRQVDHELLWRWSITRRSQLQGRVTQLDRRNSHFSARDFHGTAGKCDYLWSPTGKTRLLVSAARDYGTYQAANISYTVTDSLSVAPSWQVSKKIQVKFKLDRIVKDYLGNPGLATGSRMDRQRSAQLGFEWAPTRALLFGASMQHDQRRSTSASLDFEDTTAMLAAQFAF